MHFFKVLIVLSLIAGVYVLLEETEMECLEVQKNCILRKATLTLKTLILIVVFIVILIVKF